MRLALPRQRELDLSRPQVMGILNVTPDSFSDGGLHHQKDQAIKHALQMLEDGATIIDINNDGLLDIYVCAAAWQGAELKKDLLYVNTGVDPSTKIPSFKESAAEYGLVDTVSTHMANFFDYDNDGDLDVYLVVNDLNQEFPNNFRKIKDDGKSDRHPHAQLGFAKSKV